MLETPKENSESKYESIVIGIQSSPEAEIRRLWWYIKHHDLEKNLKIIIEKTNFARDYKQFRDNFNHPGFLDMITYWNSETMFHLIKAAGDQAKDYKSFSKFMAEYKFSEFTKYFHTTEDLHGDNLYTDMQMQDALKKIKSQEDTESRSFFSELFSSVGLFGKETVPEQFKKIINMYSKKIFERLDIASNIYSGRPKNNPNQKRNSTLANKIQLERLRKKLAQTKYESDKSKIADAIKILEAKKTEGRKLVLYVRKGHGNMDDLKFCAIAYMLNRYIVKEKRSPIFNDIQIVAYSDDFYPKQIHDLGIKKNKYVKRFGDKFKQMALAGNMFFFNHSDASEQQLLQSIPIIPQSIMSNPRKFIENEKEDDEDEKKPKTYLDSLSKSKYIPFQAFFDIRDDGNQAGYNTETKDRGRSIEKMLRASMWSVLSLENLLLQDNETYGKMVADKL